jgi:uncharacterized Zn finger protein
MKDVTITFFPVVKCPECGEEMTGRDVVRACTDDIKELPWCVKCTDCGELIRVNFEILEED